MADAAEGASTSAAGSGAPSTTAPKTNRGRGRRFNNRPPRNDANISDIRTNDQQNGGQNNRGGMNNQRSRGGPNPRNFNNRGRGKNGDNRKPPASTFAFNPNAVPFVPPVEAGERGKPKNRRGRRGRGGQNQHQVDNRSLRERLIHQLENNRYECAICYQKITSKQGVWSCKTCYHIFHISNDCIVNWAKSSRDGEDDNKWRCPTCQTKNEKMPYNYYCFCGKQKNPTYQLGETPHSCGEVCGGARKFDCPHPCTEYCHPGPCTECQQQVVKACNCGKTKKSVKCGAGVPVMCESTCEKLLNCGIHKCQQICHLGDCENCQVEIEQQCFCGENQKTIICSQEATKNYSCGQECKKFYDCGIHKCQKKCHSSSTEGCGECELGINRINACPCGKKSLKEMGIIRQKCSDQIPTCEAQCDKLLECGSAGKVHRCKEKCHTGPCPPCELTSFMICRCKTRKTDVSCEEYLKILRTTGEMICERKCKKKKSCGIHKCQEMCCIQQEHFCLQVCNKKLTCGLHNCEHVCHAGRCPKCLEANFEEMYCHCGKTVRLPPIPCGEGPPACKEICTRRQECGHEPMHNCHPDSVNCPPCTEYVFRKCHCGHETRRVGCFITDISCGIPCRKPLACGVHVCTRNCHGKECEKTGEKCKKKCEKLRNTCEHACQSPCHGDTECPTSICRQMIKVTCECGRIKKELMCTEVYKLMAMNEKEEEEKEEEKEEEEPRKLKRSSSLTQLNCLSCDDECKKLERNRKMADALNIDIDEDGETKLAPMITFPSYLKDLVKTNLEFVKTVEKVFLDILDQLNDPTKEQNMMRAHLPPMNLEKRRFIHEYATYFIIDSESVDCAPKRSIVLTAIRGRSHAPIVLISDLVNYKGALNTPGPSVIRKETMDEINKKIKGEEEGMKQLKTVERVVYKREPRPMKKLEAPKPVQQKNMFALLGSDVEDENDDDQKREEAEKKKEAEPSQPLKDWWSDEENVTGSEWKEVKMKEWVVEVEKVVEEEEAGKTWDEEEEEAEKAENLKKVEENVEKVEGNVEKMDGNGEKVEENVEKVEGNVEKMDGNGEKVEEKAEILDGKAEN